MAATELLCTQTDVINAWAFFATLTPYEQNSLINVASQRVYNRLNVTGVGYNVKTEVYSGENVQRIWLTCLPVISILSVTLNGDQLINTYGDEYGFDPTTGELWRGDGMDDQRFAPWFSKGSDNVTVQYFGGYASTPDPLIRGTVFMVKYIWEQGKVSGVYSSESLGDWSGTLNTTNLHGGLPPHVEAMIYDYVRADAFL